MYKLKNESESLELVLNDFFANQSIKQRFKFICDNNIVGCEKWIQFELYKFLKEYEYTAEDEVYLEDYFDSDLRKDKTRVKQFIDITFRLRNKQFYIPLELKRKNCLALRDIEKDILKNKSIKPTQKYFFRKIFSLLFHPEVDNNKIDIRLKSLESSVVNYEFSIRIPSTKQMCSVFSSKI